MRYFTVTIATTDQETARANRACPGRDSVPGAPHIYRAGLCVFCQEDAR